jgi:hypothetical protein
MPSHTVPSALIALFFEDPGVPWDFSQWKEITGVHHGLFPEDKSLLPDGWTAEDARDIQIYFDQYSKLPTVEDKIKFASILRSSNQAVPGRPKWQSWVNLKWKGWKIHAKITEILNVENLHPLSLTLNSKSKSKNLDWPNGGTYIPMAVDPVARALFGLEAMDNLGRLPADLRTPMQALIQRTWINIWNQLKRSKTRLGNLEKDAIEAFEGKSPRPLTRKL